MMSLKAKLLYGTALPLLVGVGVAMTGEAVSVRSSDAAQVAANPCAAANPCNPCAARNPCNPCAAKSPCNPCAAKSPCSPCAAAGPCGPCSPCAAGAGTGSECVVPRLAEAAKSPCNPCAAKNPCAAASPCGPCNPCAATNPCNPCAAVNPCNPCAAKNPCAAASPCGPCGPCGPAATPELTEAEASKLYGCLVKELRAAYAKSGLAAATEHFDWRLYNTAPYISATHGGRYVNNAANEAAKAYGKFEEAGVMPEGALLAKNSFSVKANGKGVLGPLFLMEKMGQGFSPDTAGWRFTMVMPDGSVYGTTAGKGSANVEFCAECHGAVAEPYDYMMFLPEEYRKKTL